MAPEDRADLCNTLTRRQRALPTLNLSIMSTKYWLLKAEPDSRVVKGKDVKVCSNYRQPPGRIADVEVVQR